MAQHVVVIGATSVRSGADAHDGWRLRATLAACHVPCSDVPFPEPGAQHTQEPPRELSKPGQLSAIVARCTGAVKRALRTLQTRSLEPRTKHLKQHSDRLAALREMRRVLRPDGRVALSVFRSSAGHFDLAQALVPYLGENAAQLVREPFALSSAEELASLLSGAGLRDVTITQVVKTARLPSPDAFVGYQIATRPATAVATLDDAVRAAMFDTTACAALHAHVDSQGVAFPMESHVALARA
jgi:SAM-dependent methyltransferase